MSEVHGNQINIRNSQIQESGQRSPSVLESELGLSPEAGLDITQKLTQLKTNLSPHFGGNSEASQSVLETFSASVKPLEVLLGEAGSNQVFLDLARGVPLTTIQDRLENQPGIDTSKLSTVLQQSQGALSIGKKSIAVSMGMDNASSLASEPGFEKEVNEVLAKLSGELPSLRSALSSSPQASLSTVITKSQEISNFLQTLAPSTLSKSSSVDEIQSLGASAPVTASISDPNSPPVPRNAGNPYLEPSASAKIALIFADLVDITIEMGKNQHEYMITLMSNIQENAEVKGRLNEMMRELEKQEAQAELTSAIFSLVGAVAQIAMIMGPKAMDYYKNSGVSDEAAGGGRAPSASTQQTNADDASTSSRPNLEGNKDPENVTIAPAQEADPATVESSNTQAPRQDGASASESASSTPMQEEARPVEADPTVTIAPAQKADPATVESSNTQAPRQDGASASESASNTPVQEEARPVEADPTVTIAPTQEADPAKIESDNTQGEMRAVEAEPKVTIQPAKASNTPNEATEGNNTTSPEASAKVDESMPPQPTEPGTSVGSDIESSGEGESSEIPSSTESVSGDGAGSTGSVANSTDPTSTSGTDDSQTGDNKTDPKITAQQQSQAEKARTEDRRMTYGRLAADLLTHSGQVIEKSLKIGIAEARKEIETPKALAEALETVFQMQMQNASADINETQGRVKELIDALKKLSEDYKRLTSEILSAGRG